MIGFLFDVNKDIKKSLCRVNRKTLNPACPHLMQFTHADNKIQKRPPEGFSLAALLA